MSGWADQPIGRSSLTDLGHSSTFSAGPFRATAMELTASGIDVAAAKKVTLDTMVGIWPSGVVKLETWTANQFPQKITCIGLHMSTYTLNYIDKAAAPITLAT